MKNILLFIFFLCLATANSQTDLSGIVKDSKTSAPLPYCAIGIKKTVRGCLTNEEGLFKISSVLPTDTLVISIIGYRPRMIPVTDFVRNTTIYLEQKENILTEVVVYGNDDYLYEALKKCRQKLIKASAYESKAYFVLKTELGQEPAELLECYYNAAFDNSGIQRLEFKNGRVGVAPHDGRYFVNMNTSKAISFLNLAMENKHFPAVPLQFEPRKLKKLFYLKLKSVYDTANPVYHIEFSSRKTDGKAFNGELWIEKNTWNLTKIILSVSETKQHPFLPVFKDFGEIENVSMQITKTYAPLDGKIKPSHLDFNYQVNYRHIHNASVVHDNRDTSFIVKSKGVVRFYDYDNLFYIPAFEYDSDVTDYRKITSLSYNEAFWNSNESIEYSDRMKQAITYFKKNGYLINYKVNSHYNHLKNGFFENKYFLWSEKERLILKRDSIKNDTTNTGNTFLALAYQLKAQIFFDINKAGDSLQHYSCTIFDVYNSYYNIREEPVTNCFMNIYFDLYEIERRNFEKLITGKKYSVTQLDSVYKQSNARAKEQTNTYLKEVERGKHFRELIKWNAYVKQELGIDNILLFSLREK